MDKAAAGVGVMTFPGSAHSNDDGASTAVHNNTQPSKIMLSHHEETDILLIAVRELEHFFVDPGPFSLFEVKLMGKPGFKGIVRLLSSTSAGAIAPLYHV
jgi:hypothetical protein